MKKLLLITLALGINQAHASTFNYVCKDRGKTYPLTVDDAKNTLTWKGPSTTSRRPTAAKPVGTPRRTVLGSTSALPPRESLTSSLVARRSCAT
ncbi:hypothetical protein ACQ5SK_27130 [Bradyrhizobium japonicum]